MVHLRWARRSAEFRRVWNYGKFSLGGNLSYLLYSKADSFLLAAFTGTGAVALYNAAKIFTRAFEMVTQVVQMFVIPAISRLDSRRETDAVKIVVEKAILFVTVGTLPFFLLFAVGPVPLLQILYQGRYLEAAPILRIFSLLAFAVPALSVAINTLMGLGDARRTFILGLQMTGISLAAYVLFIPWLGAPGAAIGYVASTFLMTWLSLLALSTLVRLTPMEILRRTKDITAFIKSRLRPH
jgi:O-antigen/teichoic acid export membrane protein